jgi:hypothetical protein
VRDVGGRLKAERGGSQALRLYCGLRVPVGGDARLQVKSRRALGRPRARCYMDGHGFSSRHTVADH